jgi:NAD(P)-dependent dehydrogenase (short-subunit alcohol dehydrogenase family)
MIKFAHKIALITGASRGIGHGIALKLADSGILCYWTNLSVDGGASVIASEMPLPMRGR